MGDAKRKRAREALLDAKVEQSGAVFSAVASALRRLARAASANLGGDCFVHAALAAQLLADEGLHADVEVGFSAWRVGEGDTDVIAHLPTPGMVPQPGGAPVHAWLEIGNWLFDPTVYQLEAKARMLDALDGGRTNVTWRPDYLLARKSCISSYKAVAQGHAGLFFYESNDSARRAIGVVAPPDPEDLAAARVLYSNPHLEVFGPNNTSDSSSIDATEKDSQ